MSSADDIPAYLRDVWSMEQREAELVHQVRHTVRDLLRDSSAQSQPVINTTRNIMRAAMERSEREKINVIRTTKAVAKGLVMGVVDAGGDPVMASREALHSAIHGATPMGVDWGVLASGVAHGIREATEEMGRDVDTMQAVVRTLIESNMSVRHGAI